MKRLNKWETAYSAFLLSRAKTPFAWGTNDCSSFCADGIQVITGVDIADDFRGKYSTDESAFALIHTITGNDTAADSAAYCADKYALKEWSNPLYAQRGDLVTFEAPTGYLVSGLIHLTGKVVAMGHDGLYLFPLLNVLKAWHV